MTLAAIRRHLVVPGDPERAYRVFADSFGSWWPLARFSVCQRDNSVAFEGNEIVERSATGERHVWGRVTAVDPPHRIAFTWHPGHEDERGSVEVTFAPTGDGQTLVTLVHEGWESYGAAAADAREEYGAGWPLVLAAFGDAVMPAR